MAQGADNVPLTPELRARAELLVSQLEIKGYLALPCSLCRRSSLIGVDALRGDEEGQTTEGWWFLHIIDMQPTHWMSIQVPDPPSVGEPPAKE